MGKQGSNKKSNVEDSIVRKVRLNREDAVIIPSFFFFLLKLILLRLRASIALLNLQLMLDTWNESIFSNIKNRLQDSAMKLVHAERLGEAFDSQLVIGVRESYGEKPR